MKSFLAVVLIVLGFSIVAAQTSKAENEVLAANKAWADAQVRGDLEALDKILADDLIVTAGNGTTRDKKGELADAKPAPDFKTYFFNTEDVRVKVSLFAQAEPQKPNKKEQEVRTVLKLWADAVVSRDMSALDKLFSDDLFITDHNGGTRGKKEEMEALKPSPGVKTLSVDNEDVRIRTYDKTAVVTAIVKMRFEIGGKETQIALRYTAVFVKKDGRWQITVLQTTRIVQPKTN